MPNRDDSARSDSDSARSDSDSARSDGDSARSDGDSARSDGDSARRDTGRDHGPPNGRNGADEAHRPDWIERVVAIAGALGMSEVRVRWKLIAWSRRWQQRRRRAEQKLDHIRYRHKHCPECKALQDRDARVCSRCGARLTSRARQVLGRLGLVPRAASISALLGVAIAVVYVRVAAASGSWLGADIGALIRFGGNLPRGVADDEWWRPATAIFLHAGLWHLGFNLLALATVGPRIEELYGRLSTLAIFLFTGIAASLGSAFTGLDGVGIGASGAIMGLIGAAMGWGHRKGTSYGKQLRDDMLKWTAYVLIFGFFIGADNRAHVAGLLAGAAIGYGVDPTALRGRWRPAARAIGVLAAIATAATVAAALAPVPSRLGDAYRRPPTTDAEGALDAPAGPADPAVTRAAPAGPRA